MHKSLKFISHEKRLENKVKIKAEVQKRLSNQDVLPGSNCMAQTSELKEKLCWKIYRLIYMH
jgi:hypothetical protein